VRGWVLSKRLPSFRSFHSDIMGAVRGLGSLIGQTVAVNRLAAFAKMIRETGNSAWKILLVGPDGIGKKTVAAKFAEELGSPFHALQAGSVLATGDLTGVLTKLMDRKVLFVEAINELKPPLVHLLLTAAESRCWRSSLGRDH
jgi:Holliday junction resolvasome RuvABC ATP-dependent DNA helicase subunit